MAIQQLVRVIPGGSDPWVAVINWRKYVYPAGTEHYVPAEVAVLIDAQIEHEQPKYPPAQGGGGGEGTFTVHMFYVEDGPTMVDKTFAEISQAVKSGKDVRLVYEEEDSVSVYYLVKWEADFMAQFIRIFHTDSSLMTVYTVNVFSDGTVTDYFSDARPELKALPTWAVDRRNI